MMFRYLCASLQRRINIKAVRDHVLLRTLISIVLLVTLLPVSSPAGICDVNCHTSALSSATARSSADTVHASHHHHHPSHDMMASEHETTGHASSAHHSVSHRCCKDNGPVVCDPCSIPKSSALQEQRISPKSGRELITVQAFSIHWPRIAEHLNPRTPTNFLAGAVDPLATPLRI